MSLFKKSNRKFKQISSRRGDSDDDGEQVLQSDRLEVINLESAEEIKKETALTAKNKLSFEDEEDQVEFELKKSKTSLRALRQLERKRKEAKKSSKQTDTTNQTKSIRKMMETNKESLDERALGEQQGRGVNLDCELELDEESDCDYLRKYAEYKKPSSKSGLIPDHKTIELLKRQRFLAKEQESSDFISLNSRDGQNNYNETSTSRLVREDPNDKEAICIDDDEDNADLDDDRVNFYTDKTSLQKERIKEAFFSVQNEQINDEEDDSDNEWERAQIKKGVGLPQQRDLKADDFAQYLLTNQRSQTNPYDPPAYIAKLSRPALSRDKLLEKYRDELELVTSKLDILHNQLNNIELTIENIQETLKDQPDL